MLPHTSSTQPANRWYVVSAAFLAQALIVGGIFAYGIFFTVLEAELGWSRTLLSASTSVAFLVMGVLAILIGRLNDRIGPRRVLSVCGVLCGLGYVLMSTMTQPWQLILYFGVFIGIGMAAHDITTLSTVAQWFDRRRGVMTGVVKTGTACGQVIVPFVATALIASVGWRYALACIGVFMALALFFLAQWMRRPTPADLPRVSASKSAASSSKPATQNGVSFAQARRSRTLWVLCAVQFCFFPTLITVPLHIAAHAKDLGMSTAGAASVLSALGASSIFGRLAVGFLIDRVGGKLALKACLTLLAGSLIMLLSIAQPPLLYVFAFVYGVAHGGLFTVVSPTVAEYFGMLAHGTIFGMIVLFGTLMGAVGPIMAGLIFDYTGSYKIAFQTLIIMACIGLLFASQLMPVATRPVQVGGE